jgi:hypothetical protein
VLRLNPGLRASLEEFCDPFVFGRLNLLGNITDRIEASTNAELIGVNLSSCPISSRC